MKNYLLFCLLLFSAQENSLQTRICEGEDKRARRDLWGIISNFFNPTTAAPITGPPCRQRWMQQLPNITTHIFIGRLIIPGTHNAFCTERDFTEESDLGVDLEVNILSSLDIPRSALTANKDILLKWSVTQSLSAIEQLEIGVRFFDLRVAKDEKSGSVHIVHGLMGRKLRFHLEEIKPFLEANPKEIVFLYFQKYYKMDTNDGLRMSRQIYETLGDRICKPKDFGYVFTSFRTTKPTSLAHDLTLQNVWRRNCQVFLISHMDETINEYIRFFQLPPLFWEDFLDYDGSWSNTNSVRRMKEHAEARKEAKSQVWKQLSSPPHTGPGTSDIRTFSLRS